MIFEAFEWPRTANGLNVEIDPETWKILRSSEKALHSAYNPIRGKWCYLQGKPFFMIRENNNIIIHFDGKSWSIPHGTKDFQIDERNLFFWKKFILKKGDVVILSCTYRNPDSLFSSLLSAFAYDDEYLENPFEILKMLINN